MDKYVCVFGCAYHNIKLPLWYSNTGRSEPDPNVEHKPSSMPKILGFSEPIFACKRRPSCVMYQMLKFILNFGPQLRVCSVLYLNPARNGSDNTKKQGSPSHGCCDSNLWDKPNTNIQRLTPVKCVFVFICSHRRPTRTTSPLPSPNTSLNPCQALSPCPRLRKWRWVPQFLMPIYLGVHRFDVLCQIYVHAEDMPVSPSY